MKWPEDLINKVICGDCFEVMKGMPDNCIDTIITDPPYGLEFMGKDWDKFWVKPNPENDNKHTIGSFKKRNLVQKYQAGKPYYEFILQWAIEALRVVKPGSTLLCFGGTRTYHRLACAIEDAGWIIKDCIMWLYGSGFPKASDISKQIDKGHKRKIVDKRKGTYADIRRDKNTGIAELHGGIATQKKRIKSYITAPATPEAKLWDGWKSHGLKPAYEPILVAMKPNEGSYANNALKWGVAGLDIDGGRIEIEDITKEENYRKNQAIVKAKSWWNPKSQISQNRLTKKGRYPANVILDEEAGRMLDEQSGVSKSIAGPVNNELSNADSKIYGWAKYPKMNKSGAHFGDTGGASRFFYCAKASRAERNRGCEGLEEKIGGGMKGTADLTLLTGSGNIRNNRAKNNHPTVKPLALMKYLCTLTKTPTGGIVLDPFCGSGTTLMACEELKRDYIGIDNNPEYCEIARKRVNAIPESLF